MKNSLSDYFYDRLSTKEEEKVQKRICAGEGSEEFDCDLRSLFEECLETPRHNTARNFSFGRVLPYALAFIAAIALVISIPMSYRHGQAEGENRIASIEWFEVNVPYGEQQSVTLSDGTVLHLNSGSRLTYPAEFTGGSRTVFMDGEAYLDVAKDPGCPFVIKSQNVDIKVLGTSFNFRNFAQERTAELLLMEGSVEVSLTGQDNVVRLKPGDRMRYDREAGSLDITRFKTGDYKAFYDDNALHFCVKCK